MFTHPLKNNVRLEHIMINIIPMDRTKDDDVGLDSSDNDCDEKLRTGVRHDIFRHIEARLQQVAWQGLLTEKIANIGVRSGHLDRQVRTFR